MGRPSEDKFQDASAGLQNGVSQGIGLAAGRLLFKMHPTIVYFA